MCVFCDIVEGKIPSKKIYEDDKVLAILDISQTTFGHSLVIPKAHYKNISECPKDVLHNVIDVTQDINNKLMEKLNAGGSNILTNTNEVSGQTVEHLHFHIIPRYNNNDSIKIEFQNNSYNLDEIINKIK